ncbi:MAG: hypothetical protein FJ087_13000, partial [Deltaproteobacteria bacterium]|nr:hypothetical protein [Deltaproteobacteria bacterium]
MRFATMSGTFLVVAPLVGVAALAVTAAGCGTGGATPGTATDVEDAKPDGTEPADTVEVAPGDDGGELDERSDPPDGCLDACGQDEGAPDEGGCPGP